jgi:ankyrin repeat protein
VKPPTTESSAAPHWTVAILSNCTELNAQQADGCTPVILASKYGHDQVVQLLARLGVDLNGENLDGETALSLAVQARHSPVVQVLERYGATAGQSPRLRCSGVGQ